MRERFKTLGKKRLTVNEWIFWYFVTDSGEGKQTVAVICVCDGLYSEISSSQATVSILMLLIIVPIKQENTRPSSGKKAEVVDSNCFAIYFAFLTKFNSIFAEWQLVW